MHYLITTDSGTTVTVDADSAPELADAFRAWRNEPGHAEQRWHRVLEVATDHIDDDDFATDVSIEDQDERSL